MQAAAAAAARRANDDVGCACGSRSGRDFLAEDIAAIEQGQPASSGSACGPPSKADGKGVNKSEGQCSLDTADKGRGQSTIARSRSLQHGAALLAQEGQKWEHGALRSSDEDEKYAEDLIDLTGSDCDSVLVIL